MRFLKDLRERGVYKNVNRKGRLLAEGCEVPPSGRAYKGSRQRVRLPNHYVLYQIIKICQAVNKSFGCWKLERKKFSAVLSACQEVVSSLYCAR